MPYLEPPPFPAPVVVHKDVGGYVADYRAATERYRSEDREVQLHECRSACTLALSLPGVCVYPSSQLKFHKAYDINTKVADEGISQELFSAYPQAIQAKLGTLTRSYKILTGAELIALGVRNCAESRVQFARRMGTEPRTRIATAVRSPLPEGPGISAMFQSVVSAVAKPFEPSPPAAPPGGQSSVAVASPAPAPMAPLPPRRPTDLGQVEGTVELAAFEKDRLTVAPRDMPLPPRRPATMAQLLIPTPALPRIIPGAVPILPGHAFLPFQWASR